MPQQRLTAAILLTGLLATGLGAPARAGEAGNATGVEASISDQRLQQFALALTEIQGIHRDYLPKLEQAETQAQQARLERQGRREMLAAIRDTGLEVAEYNRIGRRIRADDQLRQRVEDLLQRQDGN